MENKRFNTEPCVLHAYSKTHFTQDWINLVSKSEIVIIPEDLTVMSFFSGNNNFPLKEQLERSNILYVDAAKDYIGFWEDKLKIKLLLDHIGKIKTNYLLVLDGIDCLLYPNIKDILNNFKTFNCKLLYNASMYSHYLNEEKVDDKEQLNTGAFLGETKFIELFYKDVLSLYEREDIPHSNTDGIRVGMKWKNYKEIKVDKTCKIFQTLLGNYYTNINNNLIIQ
jgi:hypothetical protein